MIKSRRVKKYKDRRKTRKQRGGNRVKFMADWKRKVEENKPLPPITKDILDTIGSDKVKEYYEDYKKNPLREATDAEKHDVMSDIINRYARHFEWIQYLIDIDYVPKNKYVGRPHIINLFRLRSMPRKDSYDILDKLVSAGLNIEKNGAFNPLRYAIQEKRWDIVEVLLNHGADTSEIPKSELDTIIPFSEYERIEAEKKEAERKAADERWAAYLRMRHNVDEKVSKPHLLPPDQQNELRALLAYETQPFRGKIPGKPNHTPMTVDARIAAMLEKEPPLTEEMIVWRGHSEHDDGVARTIYPDTWFSTSLYENIATELFTEKWTYKCCLFKIHLQPGIRQFNLYDIYKRYGVVNPLFEQDYLKGTIMKDVKYIKRNGNSMRNAMQFKRYTDYSTYGEVIVEGGGVFYKDKERTEPGFVEIKPGVFETYYFPR